VGLERDNSHPTQRWNFTSVRERISDSHGGDGCKYALPDDANDVIDGHWLSQDAGDIEVREIVGGTRDDDDRNSPAVKLSREILTYRETVNMWQTKVENDQVRGSCFDELQGVEAVPGFDDLERFQSERSPPQGAQGRVVFDYQDDRLV
jgi:hypothetical protein